MLFALDVLLLKVMHFKIRFCSTCTGRTTAFYARPNQLCSIANANGSDWKRSNAKF